MAWEHEMDIGQEARAFGNMVEQAKNSWAVEDFKLIVWIDGTWETDITASLSPEQLAVYKNQFVENFTNNFPMAAS